MGGPSSGIASLARVPLANEGTNMASQAKRRLSLSENLDPRPPKAFKKKGSPGPTVVEPSYQELLLENRALQQRLRVLQIEYSELQTNRNLAWTKYYELRDQGRR